MARYRDYTFNHGDYGTAQEVTDASAIALAIKNIILSRPGNFPRTPGLGVDIEKYEFEQADSKTLSEIKTDITTQIGKYIPSIETVDLNVTLIEDTNEGIYKGRSRCSKHSHFYLLYLLYP